MALGHTALQTPQWTINTSMEGEQSNWQKIVDHWTLSEHEYRIGDSEQSSSCREIQDLKEVRLHSNNDDQKMEALLFIQQEREGNTRRRARRFLTPWPRMILSSWRKTLGMMSKRSKSGTGQSAWQSVNQSHSLSHQLRFCYFTARHSRCYRHSGH